MGNYFNTPGTLSSAIISNHHYHIDECYSPKYTMVKICKNKMCFHHGCRGYCYFLKVICDSKKVIYYNCDNNCNCPYLKCCCPSKSKSKSKLVINPLPHDNPLFIHTLEDHNSNSFYDDDFDNDDDLDIDIDD